KRLQRGEEIARRIAHPVLGLTVLAKLRAQGLEQGGAARHLDAAKLQPLKFIEQIAARLWRQSLQVVCDPVGLQHGTQFSATDPGALTWSHRLAGGICALATGNPS